jgi:hypothetical protein
MLRMASMSPLNGRAADLTSASNDLDKESVKDSFRITSGYGRIALKYATKTGVAAQNLSTGKYHPAIGK